MHACRYFDTGIRINNGTGTGWTYVGGCGSFGPGLGLSLLARRVCVFCTAGTSDTLVRLHECLPPLYRGYLLNMTSQAWLDTTQIDRVIWTHQLVRGP